MDQVKLTAIDRIVHPLGDVIHVLKSTDPSFAGFGEAYFTSIHCGAIKGWKLHQKMTMNLVVPVGKVRFHVRDPSRRSTAAFLVGVSNYARLTIPPGLWVAFEGLAEGTSLILNLANIAHDPAEAFAAPLETYPLMSE